MRRRKRNQTDDSFDLFLDTITNTFGGVLLITLLIVLLIKDNTLSSENRHQSAPEDDLLVVESQIEALLAQKQSLAANLQVQQTLIQNFENKDTALLSQQLADQLSELSQLEQAAAKLSMQTKAIAQSNQGLEAEQQTLEQNLANKTAEYEKLSKQLQAEITARTQTMPLPKENRTNKREVPILLVNNQLHILNSNRSGTGFTPNTQHFENSSAGQADFVFAGNALKAIAGKGIPAGSDEWVKEMGQYSSERVFLTFVVRSNSFDSFGKIRDLCVNQGFEYRILPTDDVIGQGGNNAKVQ
jgi:hypothetical protein